MSAEQQPQYQQQQQQQQEEEEVPKQLQRQVFISHTGQDCLGRIFATSILQPALQAAGISTYTDCMDLHPGSAWPTELVQAAATSAVFVAVITKTYPKRFWCLRELDLALHGHPDYPRTAKPCVIPVFIDSHKSISAVSAEQVLQHVQKRLDSMPPGTQQVSEQITADTGLHSLFAAELRDLHSLQLPHAAARVAGNMAVLTEVKHSIRRQRQDDPNSEWQQLLRQLEQQQQQQQPSGPPVSLPSPPAKNEEYEMARKVVAQVLLQLPVLAYLDTSTLVGYQGQLAQLTAQLMVDEPSMLGLWLHGPGRYH
jgi:hypothetical protein